MRIIYAIAATILILSAPVLSAGPAPAAPEAKRLFGKVAGPVSSQPNAVGFYSRGCLAGAAALPVDGPEWQAMRLSRNRNWGTPGLVSYIEKLAKDARVEDGWPGLLVGDMSQPRGGPMLTGHASHQVGLDVDIWFDPMPNRVLTAEEREELGASSYIRSGTNVELDKSRWTDAHNRLIKRAASYPEVQRIFVNAGIKKELCAWAGNDRSWLHKIRPWYAHDDHFHVRLRCPPGMDDCRPQDPTPSDDGCGENLAWWLSPDRYKPAEGPITYAPELTMADLPAACTSVLTVGPNGLPADALEDPPPPLPRLRPEMN